VHGAAARPSRVASEIRSASISSWAARTWNRNRPALVEGVDALVQYHQVHPALVPAGGQLGEVTD
jgi:hypothetical protein